MTFQSSLTSGNRRNTLEKSGDILARTLVGRCQLKSALSLLDGRIRNGCGVGDVVKEFLPFFRSYDVTFPGDMDDESFLSSLLKLGWISVLIHVEAGSCLFYLLSASSACVLIPVACISNLGASFEESLQDGIGLSAHVTCF